jgi:hypothetical protein
MTGANYVKINGEYVSAGKARSDAAKGVSQPVAAELHPELQRVIPQALDRHAPCQDKGKKSAVLCRVLIVRYGRRTLDDDNLATSYKNFRDELAAQLGIDDGDPRIKFSYDQVTTKGATGTHIVITQI